MVTQANASAHGRPTSLLVEMAIISSLRRDDLCSCNATKASVEGRHLYIVVVSLTRPATTPIPATSAARPGSTFGMLGGNEPPAFADLDTGITTAVMQKHFSVLATSRWQAPTGTLPDPEVSVTP